ncbi:hypothetical protein PsorP6_014275 [Peronosclerospora sorghi]|uniref:Uncharacterized protein n=1 Tax=Peronosclerospora sorghi TaxID=230839 RepID=A0ACC0VJY2_9STRA|nr:hypothetical protein PsorP6_014275 [Peronosclerospora sorghi]
MADNIPPFPQIELTPEERARYDRNVKSFLGDAVAEYASQHSPTNEKAWLHVRQRGQLSIYKSVYGTRDPQVTLFKGTGFIHGPVQDVMDGLYCDTTDDLRACKTLLKYKLVDGCIMNVSERRSPDAPFRFAGIKWFAARAAWGLTKHRDVLAYERMGTIRDEHGTELAYHVLHSIDHPSWPIDAIKHIKREHQVTCFLYRDVKESVVECFIWSTVYNLDSVATRLAEYVVAGTLLNVTSAVNSARAKKYSMLMKHAQHHKWPATSHCHICYGRSFMSTNRPCAGCFQSVCKSCSDYRFIFHLDAKTGRPHQQRFCKLCINSTVLIDAQTLEITIQSASDDGGVPQRSFHTNLLKSSTKSVQSARSAANASLRSHYFDWSSQDDDDDDDEYLQERTEPGKRRVRSKSCRNGGVSLSDLDAEDKFSPYPPTPQAHKTQREGRNKHVLENRVHAKRCASQRSLSFVSQPVATRSPSPPKVAGHLPPFRAPYQPVETKAGDHVTTFSRESVDGADGTTDLPLQESDLSLSTFDLGVVEAAPVEEDEAENLELSMCDNGARSPPIPRARRYGRMSHADKDGFLSDLYSLSRSRVHGYKQATPTRS